MTAGGGWRAAGGGSGGIETSTSAHDTTGGIQTKINEAAAVAAQGVPVVIARAGTPSGRLAIVHGPRASEVAQSEGWEWLGTVVTLAADAL